MNNSSAGHLLHLRLHLSALVMACFCAAAAYADAGTYVVNGQTVNENTYKAAQALDEGLALLQKNQEQQAMAKFQEAIGFDPNLAEAHHNVGYVLMKEGRSSEAIEEYKTTLRLKDTIESTWMSLGALYQSTGQMDNAIGTYRGFLAKFPHSAEAPRVRSLVSGLENERGNQLFQSAPTALLVHPQSDYYNEVTRFGVKSWPAGAMPLTVFIYGGQEVPGFRPEFDAILRQAFLDWAAASNGAIRFKFVPNPSDAKINCSWANDPTSLSNQAEQGEATTFTDGAGIKCATMRLLTVSISLEVPLTLARMRVYCLHEIGHTLGLAGHSGNPGDIMFYSSLVADERRDLSQRDRNTLIRLYANGVR